MPVRGGSRRGFLASGRITISRYRCLPLPTDPGGFPRRPHLVTIHGNGKPGETFLVNTAFVSRNHATRHGAECFVYNGVDPSDYIYREQKSDYLVFLAKASWRVKNVKGAIRLSRLAHRTLRIVGGRRLFPFNHRGGIHWEGFLGGRKRPSWWRLPRVFSFPCSGTNRSVWRWSRQW